jgi:hypothetical protein
LKDARGGQKNLLVHSLVLLAFVGLRPLNQETRHLSGARADNRLKNLCYGTKQENAADRERHGAGYRGEKNGNSKLSDVDVDAIRAYFRTTPYKRGMYSKIARQYSVSSRLISYLVYDKIRLH